MSHLTEVPTDELLSFQDYPTTHTSTGRNNFDNPQINVNLQTTDSPSFQHQYDTEPAQNENLSEDPNG